jgi:ankyrin repeat protein
MSDPSKKNPLVERENGAYHQFTELCLASQQGDLEHLKILFNRGADFNQSDYDGRTPLHIAVSESHLEVCQFLIRIAKCNIHKIDRWNATPHSEGIKNPALKPLFTESYSHSGDE